MLTENRSIAKKIVKTSIILALTTGLLLSAFEVYQNYTQESARFQQSVQQILKAAEKHVDASVSTQRDNIASDIVDGLFEYDFIFFANILDAHENVLAEKSRDNSLNSPTSALTKLISTEYKTYVIDLTSIENNDNPLGRLSITINMDAALAPFYSRSIGVLISGVVSHLVLVLCLFILLRRIIDQLLSNRKNEFSDAGTEDISTEKISIPEGCLQDEFDESVNSVNQTVKISRDYLNEIKFSENKYRAMFETSIIGMVLNDKNGNLVKVNQAFLNIIGYTEAEAFTLTFWDITPKIYNKDTQRQLKLLKEQGCYGPYEKEYIHKDGHLVPVLLNGVSITGPDKEDYIWSYIQDLTQRKEIEIKYRRLFELTGTCMSIVEADGTFSLVNNTFAALAGSTPEALIGIPFTKLIDEDSRQVLQKYHLARLQGDEAPDSYEFAFVTLSGKKGTGSLHAAYLADTRQTIISVIDITAKKIAEEQLLLITKSLQRAQKIANLGNWSFRVADESVEWSDQLYTIFGRDRKKDPLTYESLLSWVHPDDRQRHHEYMARMLTLSPETATDIENLKYRLVRPDEEIRWVEVVFESEFNDDKTLSRFFGTVQDITEEYLAEEKILDSARQLRVITNNAPVLIAHCDTEKRYKFVNKSYAELFGFEPSDIIGKHVREVLGDHAYAHALSHMEQALSGHVTSYELRMDGLLDDSSYLYVKYVPEFDHQQQVVGFIAAITDITERKQAEEKLIKLSMAVKQTPNAIFITDFDGNIEYINQAFTDDTGYKLNEVIGKTPRILKSGKTPQAVYEDMWAHLSRGKEWRGELINRHKNGNEYIDMTLISPVRDSAGKITHYLAFKENITEKKRSEERIKQLAYFDQLTGLPNRVQLTDRFTYTLQLSERSGASFVLMFLDLDHFKSINDTLGHSVGDKILIEVANRLRSILREEDTLCRQGGDEFILLLPDTAVEGARDVALKMIKTITQPSQIEDHELTSTISIGIAVYPDDGQNFETLFKNADTAMYRVKQTSRNDYRFFTEEMQAHSARSLQVMNALRYASDRNQLELYYQPQISLETGRVIGVEALLRWHHPEMGWVSPIEFIQVAEDSGQILHIGEWVIRRAVHQLKTWIDSGITPFVMAVNLSPVQFRKLDFPDLVMQVLDEANLLPKYLELELTEAAAMDDPRAAIDMMNQLHDRGIKMSIDDFGTGYSSLSYLKKFKTYKVKIDQSFVRDITEDPDDKAIVTAIISLASSLGMRTIAEGVETSSQLAYLRLQGCDEVQGNYFSKPLPADEFELFIRRFDK